MNQMKKATTLFILLWVINAVPYLYSINFEENIDETGILKIAAKIILSTSISTISIILLTSNIKIFHSGIVLLFSILWLISSYFSITFGDYDLSVIASLLETTPSEASEYIYSMHIPPQLYLVIPYFFILKKTYNVRINKKNNIDI